MEKAHRITLIVLYEIVLIIPLSLMCWWVFWYLGGLGWSSSTTTKFNWHPLAMITGMLFLLGNAAVAYRLFPYDRATNKKIHATLNLLAVAFIVFGLYAVIDYHNDHGINNFYSLHSWLGLFVSTTFITQALLSVFVFQDFDPTQFPELRSWYKPAHIVYGTFLLFGAIIVIEAGIVEKAMFRVKSGDLNWMGYTTEAILVNLLCSSVALALIYMIYILYNLTLLQKAPYPEEVVTEVVDSPQPVSPENHRIFYK